MPHRRPKPSIVLGAVAALAVASPFAAYTLGSTSSDIDSANESTTAIPTDIAELALQTLPDMVVPLRELTGLALPDLNLGDLKKIPLPDSIPLPDGLPPIDIPDLRGILGPGGLISPDLAPSLVDGYGTDVKEVSRATPFSMIALTARDLTNADAKVRVKLPNGEWGPWWSTEQIDTRKNDATPAGGKSGTEPIYVGETTAAQVLVTKRTGPAQPLVDPTPAIGVVPSADTGTDLGYVPASISTPLHQDPAGDDSTVMADPAIMDDLSVVLIEPGDEEADANLADIAAPLRDGGPRYISRAQWGADESINCQEPYYDDFVSGATVHHTAGNNDYTRKESAGIVRAIYAYHAKTLDWCDIGYNALVDKYGQIFEGRAGGLDQPVQGAHAGGFNENTVGVAMMGNFEDVRPTRAQLDATGKFIGWRLKVAGVDPLAETTMYSEGTEFTFYDEGEEVELPTIFAHRDVGNTECPGDAAYAEMDTIRDIAADAAYGSSDSSSENSGGDGTGNEQYSPAEPPVVDYSPAPPAIESPAEPPAVETPVRPEPRPANPDLRRLVNGLIQLSSSDVIAQKWLELGGEHSTLGVPQTEIQPIRDGYRVGKFANGYIYSNPAGKVVTVVGKILQEFISQGLDTGALGLPLSDEIPVPEGMKVEFERGFLIFDQASGFVSTMLKTYQDGYQDGYGG